MTPDYDISTEDSSENENENENTYTEASSDNSSSDPETESNAKSVQSLQEFDDAKVKDKTKADLNWIKLSSRRTDQITENNLQEMAAWLFSAVFVKAKKQRALEHGLREELLLSPRIGFENYPSRKAFATDSHSSTFSDLINQWLLWKLCYILRKKIETKRTKMQLSLWHG